MRKQQKVGASKRWSVSSDTQIRTQLFFFDSIRFDVIYFSKYITIEYNVIYMYIYAFATVMLNLQIRLK